MKRLIPRIWLESDRYELRRRRLREAMATASLVVFALGGGALNYLWVNGVPGFMEAAFSAAEEDDGGQVQGALSGR